MLEIKIEPDQLTIGALLDIETMRERGLRGICDWLVTHANVDEEELRAVKLADAPALFDQIKAATSLPKLNGSDSS